MTDKKVTYKYILAVIGAVLFAWLLHEFAHWLTGEFLGYNSIMRINGTSVDTNRMPTDWHKVVISASGPVVTFLQAFIIFLFLKSRHWNKYLYPLLFTAFYMRFLAGLINFINPNDEGRIGIFLDVGLFTIPAIVTALLFLMVYGISKKYKLGWKFQLITTFVVMVSSSVLILSDQFYGIRIL
ncbi:hypothetical protein GCM10007103_35260 [Salinimicrobium marinum]|uniref:Uncharacterized protein n=1 Tax=Salinimicrobium marinum TaxID=680283 RepID=A0A918SMQ8_9FLAO|nr:hypothetical protein [Salinimicrobium marinum]GHA51752.1 hypothetical protein GCM10007103_35260 [Salinimicrobium marinum]